MFEAAVWITGALLLWAPGFVLTRFSRRARGGDLVTSIARAIGVGLCVWPLLLLWTTSVGLRVSVSAARALFAVALIAAVVLLVRRTGDAQRRPYAALTMSFIVIVTIITRISQVRDLVLPAWVDSVHHTAIARLITDSGHIPETYDPLIPQGAAFYHWGFHAGAAWLCWVLGATDPFDIAHVLLHYGQLLNAATVVMVYAAARLLFRSWRAGVIAAVIAGLVSYFPAYYVSWGRYTHLAGLLVLLVLSPALWRLYARRSIAELVVAAILAAGLILIHARIAFFALTFAIVLGLFLILRGRRWRFLLRWSAAAIIAALLASPWLVQLSQLRQATGILTPREAEFTTPADVRANHLWVPRNRELLSVATGGLTGILGWPRLSTAKRVASVVFWAVLLFCAQRGRSRRAPWQPLALLAAWMAVTALLLNLEAFGLPRLQFASNTAAIISLFIPLSLAAAAFLSWIIASLVRRRFRRVVTLAAVIAIGGFGAAGLMNVVNPATVLAQKPDLEALRWIRDNVPAGARFAIRAHPWLGGSYVGIDGGYWISVLTDRHSILPPALYMWASPPAVAAHINSVASRFSRADTRTDVSLRAAFARERIDYLYFGNRPGEPHPARFERAPFADLVYDRGGVKIFRVR